MSRVLRAAALALAATPLPLHAKPIQESDVQSGKVQLDPSSGYIYLTGATRMSGIFLRVPDQEARDAYEKDRAKAFDKAVKHYQSQLSEWSSAAESAHGGQVADKPEQPTKETFAIDPIELRGSESYGPFFVYAKGGDTFSYFNSVKPGTWIYYGPMLSGANGSAAGECFCLGTVRFEVKPGVITDLGNALSNAPQWDADADVGRLLIKETNQKRIAAGKEPLPDHKGPVSYGVPASLAAWPSVRAELHASPKMNNFFGATVSRMAPIPGVLAYHRDVVVDERTGQELPSPTIVNRAKIKN